jgi:hypothetical protein
MTLKLLAASIALAALLAPSLRAQSPVVYNTGDLLLGFRAAAGTTGAGVDYVLDLGPAATFRNATGTIDISGLGNFAADMAAHFGSTWDTTTSGDVFFAAVAYTGATPLNGDPAQTVYTTNNFYSTPWPYSNTQSTVGALIQNVGVKYGESTSTANSPVGVLQSITTQYSYGSYQPTGSAGGGISFGQWSPTNEGFIGNTLQLDELVNGVSSTAIGTLQVIATGNNGDGEILFSPIPEPSPLALLPIAFGGLALVRRRPGKRRTEVVKLPPRLIAEKPAVRR